MQRRTGIKALAGQLVTGRDLQLDLLAVSAHQRVLHMPTLQLEMQQARPTRAVKATVKHSGSAVTLSL